MSHLPIPEGWTLSENNPGYYQKSYQRGNATITILRPLLEPEEAAKIDARLSDATAQFILACERQAREVSTA